VKIVQKEFVFKNINRQPNLLLSCNLQTKISEISSFVYELSLVCDVQILPLKQLRLCGGTRPGKN